MTPTSSPYNFQTMVEAWDAYREEHQRPLWELLRNRSRVYAGLRARWGDEEGATTVNTVALGLNKAPNAVSADETNAKLAEKIYQNARPLIETK